MFGLKSKLKENRTTKGAWITLAHPAIAEIFCAEQPDWIVVDLEHSSLTIREMEDLIRVISNHRVTPLVRLTNNDSSLIKRVMDSGACGILVPAVKNREDIQKAYQAMHYPPSGIRGVGLARAQKYGEGFKEYLNTAKDEFILIPQIEHIDAVTNIEDIMSMNEVDGMILGPYDLSASMHIPGQFEDKAFQANLQKTISATKKYKKPCGIHIVEARPEEVSNRLKEGMNFLAYSLDIRILASGIKEGLKQFNDQSDL